MSEDPDKAASEARGAELRENLALTDARRTEEEQAKAEQAAEEATKEAEKLSRKRFDKELEKLQRELVTMQEYVKATGQKIVVIFEGRDAAGKGGVIKRIAERIERYRPQLELYGRAVRSAEAARERSMNGLKLATAALTLSAPLSPPSRLLRRHSKSQSEPPESPRIPPAIRVEIAISRR